VLLVISGIVGLLVSCGVFRAGLFSHAIVLPSVLVRTDQFWIGDLCRATQSSTLQYVQPCAPGYTVDLLIYGRSMRHYTLLHLPP
jgi:hypothetical protein